MTLVSSFDFDLPPDLIAQEPSARGTSRLLVVHRHAREWKEASIQDLPSLLAPGDLVVANDTRVFPARLLGRRPRRLAVRVGPVAQDEAVGRIDAQPLGRQQVAVRPGLQPSRPARLARPAKPAKPAE